MFDVAKRYLTLLNIVRVFGLYVIYFIVELFTILQIFKKDSIEDVFNMTFLLGFFIAAIFLLCSKYLRFSFVFSYFCIVYFSYKFPMLKEIHLNYLAWGLLFLFSVKSLSPKFKSIHPYLANTYWISLGVGYTTMGFLKTGDSFFYNGWPLFDYFSSWMTPDSFGYFLLLNKSFLKVISFVIIVFEAIIFPLVFFKKGRVLAMSLILTFNLSIFIFTLMKNIAVLLIIFQLIGFFLLKEEARYVKWKNFFMKRVSNG
jgi:hypothetical protein